MAAKRTRIIGMASLVVGSTLFGLWPARAHHEPLIQPGAAAHGGRAFIKPYTPCTLNFVFRDARHTYIGSAARCTLEVGERFTMADREFGTVVFRVLTPDGLDGTSGHIDDFALIRVDASETHRVSPVILDLGRAPHGMATSAETADAPPQQIFMTGQGLGFGQYPTRFRTGYIISDDPMGFDAAIVTGAGDEGAPVVTNSWKAYGVIIATVNHQSGMTVERVLHLLDEADFDVELVTGYDEAVRRSA